MSHHEAPFSHADLVARAERWLKQQGCGITIRDPFRARTPHGEFPDAIGWRDGLSILVECKVSRADFLADRRKSFRVDPEKGMGDWRFYLAPPGIIHPVDLPAGWGLLWALPKIVRRIHGVPGNTGWWRQKPFAACKRSETVMLASALRRLTIRGQLPKIYEDLTLDEAIGR